MNRIAPTIHRRHFIKTIGAAALSAPFITRDLISAPPSGVLRHAAFGAAGMAWADLQAICSNDFVKLVAVAEVDFNRLERLKSWYPDVRVYQDWRELLDREAGNIDSVNVSTPDHVHAPIAVSAMQLGKHVYCEKPLAHDLHETRVMTRLAREKRLVTQMGIQNRSQQAYRQAVALVHAGAIGKVREVHSWSGKGWGDFGPPPVTGEAVPAGLDWNLWLGGCEERPYVGDTYYHPKNWRKRLDFGTGTLGDMACHILDPVFGALDLTAPVSVRSEGPEPDAWNWAVNAKIRYVFPGTRHTAEKTVPLTWYDGDERPPAEVMELIALPPPTETPQDTTEERQRRLSQGSIVIGTEGVLHIPHVSGPPWLFPRANFKDYPLPQVQGSHHWSDWAEACLSGATPSASFDYSGPLTEAVLLGTVAVRFRDTTLDWNARRLQFDNVKEANAFVRRQYRNGWEVAGL